MARETSKFFEVQGKTTVEDIFNGVTYTFQVSEMESLTRSSSKLCQLIANRIESEVIQKVTDDFLRDNSDKIMQAVSPDLIKTEIEKRIAEKFIRSLEDDEKGDN